MKLKNSDFLRLKEFMYTKYGINLDKKETLVEARLGIYINRLGYKDFTSYIDDIVNHNNEDQISILVEKLTTNFTYFMREEKHYQFLKDDIILKQTQKNNINIKKEFNIWSAAASTGEEVYCIAMLMEMLRKKNININYSLTATDISKKVLRQAHQGIYSKSKISKLPKTWIDYFFVDLKNDNYKINDSIRRNVKFGYFNLNDNLGWQKNKFDVIFCRNVMIYFDNKTKEILCKKLYESLKPGGYLIIGMTETISNLKTDFKCVKPSIYIK